MIDHMAKSLGVRAPEPISWAESVQHVLVPNYLKTIQEYGGKLNDLTLEQAVRKLGDPLKYAELLNSNVLPHITDNDARRVFGARVVGTIAILAFQQRGWTIHNPIGQVPYITKPSQEDNYDQEYNDEEYIGNGGQAQRLEPFEWIEAFIERKCTWEELLGHYQTYSVDSVALNEIIKSN
jgi:hypothetical protein